MERPPGPRARPGSPGRRRPRRPRRSPPRRPARRARRSAPSMPMRWSPCASTRPPRRRAGTPRMRPAVVASPARGRRRARSSSATVVEAVRLLDRSSSGAAHDGAPTRQAGRQRDQGQLVDQRGHDLGLDLAWRRARPGAPRGRRPARRPPSVRRLKTVMRAPMRSSTVRMPVRAGFSRHAAQEQARLGQQRRGDEERRGRARGRPGPSTRSSVEALDRPHRDALRPVARPARRRPQQALGVVARRRSGLDHRRSGRLSA